jgi:DNA-binding transcriptional ArsR family regulator
MPPTATIIDSLFRALSDPTRRRVLERLRKGSASAGELSEPFRIALPSFMEHLAVLEGCGLVRSKKEGRLRVYRLARRRLRMAETWLARQRM